MKFMITVLAATGLALVFSASPASSADNSKTWYVYCEGSEQGDHWAVFSENFWPHPLTEGYGRKVASAAKAFFESRHDVRLEGCAGVNFVDSSLAEFSRRRTAQLHKKMGDRVFYFPLPDEALPIEAQTPMNVVEVHAADATAHTAAPAARVGKSSEPTTTFTPQRTER